MKIRIGTPLTNDLDPPEKLIQSMRDLRCNFHEHLFEFITINGAIIANNRNEIVKSNLSMDFDKLLFIDSDIEFEAADFKALLDADRPVISALYELRSGKNSAWYYGEDYSKSYPVGDNIFDVTAMGMGFCLIDRKVFVQMDELNRPPYFYYPWCEVKKEYLGEDVGFCMNCHRLDIPVAVDMRVKVNHSRRLCGTV